MEKVIEHFNINGMDIEIPVLHAQPEELIPAFKIGVENIIYRAGNSYWEKIMDPLHHSQLFILRKFPTDISIPDGREEITFIKEQISEFLSMEMSCGSYIYKKVCEPRYYIPSNPHLRLIEETHSIEQAKWVNDCGFRVYNAYEYDKAEQVAEMIRCLVFCKPQAKDKSIPTPRIQVLMQNYIPTIGGDPVPGVLLSPSDLRKLSALELEFYAGRDEYLDTLQDSYVFVGPFEEVMKVVMGKREVVPYITREKAVEEFLELSGDVYAVTDDELDEEQIERIADIIRTCDVQEMHYAAANVLGVKHEQFYPTLPVDGEDEIPFDTIRESVKDYLEFSHLTSKVWAFNLTFEQITRQHIDLIAAVAGCCDTEVIYLAADCVLGTNPDLLCDPIATTDTEEAEDEDAGDFGMAMVFTSPRGKTIRFDSWGNSEDEKGNPIYYVGMCCHCHNKYRSILGNRAAKSPSATACYVKGCENNTDYYADFAAEDVTFVEDFETVPGAFEYGCYHFVPVGTFKNKEFNEIVKKLRIDPELGVCTAGYAYPCKVPYSYESFYSASSVKTADVFKCLDNGKLYTACQNDLQLFEGEYLPLGLKWD